MLTDAEEQARAVRALETCPLTRPGFLHARLLHGDVVEQLRGLPDNHFDPGVHRPALQHGQSWVGQLRERQGLCTVGAALA